jgi:Mrp family chromosome partitioning ATPase/capsular polysaccharide biosynthesis protein
VQDILAARQADTSTAAEEAPSLVQAIWRERWVVLACVLIAGLAGFLLSNLQSPKYTTSSEMIISADQDFDPLQTTQNGDAARYVANQVAVIDSVQVLQDALTREGLNIDVGSLRDGTDLKVTAGTDDSVITIAASWSDPATAQKIADGIPIAYQAYVKARVADSATRAAAQAKSGTSAQSIEAAAQIYGSGVSSVENAVLPSTPSSPAPVRNALILALIGLIAGTGYALYTQSWSRRRVGPVEASAIFGAPILCEVPDRGRITAEDAIAAAYSEPGDAYRMAAVGLDYIRGTAPGVFLVTAPHDGAGSSLTALNLAAAAADHGRRVFLLNIEDTVRPQSEADAGVLRVPLHDLAQGRIDLGHAVERRAASRAQFGIIRLQVLQPVQGHPVPDVQQILDQLPDDTDLVLLDAPPLPASSASFVLAGQVDAAVVVIDQATTPADLEELQRRCRLAGIPVAGVLVNHIHRSGGASNRRRRRAGMGALPPPRMYETSPRGLPILTGGANMGDGRLHHPDTGGIFPVDPRRAAANSNYGIDPQQPPYGRQPAGLGQDPTYVAGAQPGYPPAGPPPYQETQPAYQDTPGRASSDVPWSAVTRVTPGWEQEDAGEHDAGGRNRSRR